MPSDRVTSHLETDTKAKERPILFSGAMVRAILDGKKTQTRRVVKARRFDPAGRDDESQTGWCTISPTTGWTPEQIAREYHCPNGQPGDRLWVRERHVFIADLLALNAGVVYSADGAKRWLPDGSTLLDGKTVYNETKPEKWKHRPPMFLPRWASRITLDLLDVRVQRLQEISEDDARAEGFTQRGHWWGVGVNWGGDGRAETARGAFEWVWDALNEKRGYGWDVNPFVWALTFKRVEVSNG